MKAYNEVTKQINRIENLISNKSSSYNLALDQSTKIYKFINRLCIIDILNKEGFKPVKEEHEYILFKNDFAKVMLWADKINIYRCK